MSFVHGKNAVVKITDATGAQFDLSPFANEIAMPKSIDTAETSHFGSQAKTYLVGLDDSTASIKGMFDLAADAIVEASVAAVLDGTNDTINVEYAPAGTATGNPKYTFSTIPTAYEVTSPVGDVVAFTLSLQRTGPTTRATY